MSATAQTAQATGDYHWPPYYQHFGYISGPPMHDWTNWPVTQTIVFGEVLPSVGRDGLVSTATPVYEATGACPWCSSEFTGVIHSGPCPRIKSVEYFPNGTVKRVEFNE